MPARDKSNFPLPDGDSGKPIVPSGILEDDALWMLLNAYADGEATPEEAARVEALLRTEASVAREFSFLQLTSESVHEIVELDPPPAMTEAIFAATTRRKTWAQYVRGLWLQAAAVLAPTPVRLGLGASLAAGVLVVVVWHRSTTIIAPFAPSPSQTAAGKRPQHEEGHTPRSMTANLSTPYATVAPDVKRHDKPKIGSGEIKVASASHFMPSYTGAPFLGSGKALLMSHNSAGASAHGDKLVRPRAESANAGAQVASANANKVEERHMAANGGDATGKAPKDDTLGPDVDTYPSADSVAMADPQPAMMSDAPPTVVTAVNYKPGSISERVRNSAPPVPTLAMRAQEAIKREHDLQQYGGYGKDTYKSIQRGEVGLSLVGGRF